MKVTRYTRRAFTLTEILVVLTIISVILSFMIPFVIGGQKEHVVPTLLQIQKLRADQQRTIEDLNTLKTLKN